MITGDKSRVEKQADLYMLMVGVLENLCNGEAPNTPDGYKRVIDKLWSQTAQEITQDERWYFKDKSATRQLYDQGINGY